MFIERVEIQYFTDLQTIICAKMDCKGNSFLGIVQED